MKKGIYTLLLLSIFVGESCTDNISTQQAKDKLQAFLHVPISDSIKITDYKIEGAVHLFYNPQNEQCRTSDVSPVFHCIAGLAREIEGKKEGGDQVYLVAARCVAPKGIEPLPKVPETFVLSIKLQSHLLKECKGKDFSIISIR